MSSIASRIKSKMTELGLNQADLAKRAGVSQVTIHSLTSGKSGTTRRAAEIAGALGVSIEWLLTGHEDSVSTPIDTDAIPIVSWIAAGNWMDISNPHQVGDADDWILSPVKHGQNAFALRVRGQSMEPDYRDGDIIFVDPSVRPENGSHVIVRMEGSGEATFKKLVIEGQEKYLEALNPHWPNRIIRINGDATIVGVVFFSGRMR